MSSFQQARAQALSLESKTQQLLNKYSSFLQSTSSSSTALELSLERNVERQLNKSDEIIQIMINISEQDLTLPLSKLQQLQRQREILQEQKRDFNRIKNAIFEERNRMNLLYSVRDDIDSHNQQEQEHMQDEDSYIQHERQRTEESHNIVDRLINDALHTREIFSQQSSTLNDTRQRITQSLATVPGINTLIKKINTRKKRDSLILATLITICIIILWFIS